jgi:hypothetical protein
MRRCCSFQNYLICFSSDTHLIPFYLIKNLHFPSIWYQDGPGKREPYNPPKEPVNDNRSLDYPSKHPKEPLAEYPALSSNLYPTLENGSPGNRNSFADPKYGQPGEHNRFSDLKHGNPGDRNSLSDLKNAPIGFRNSYPGNPQHSCHDNRNEYPPDYKPRYHENDLNRYLRENRENKTGSRPSSYHSDIGEYPTGTLQSHHSNGSQHSNHSRGHSNYNRQSPRDETFNDEMSHSTGEYTQRYSPDVTAPYRRPYSNCGYDGKNIKSLHADVSYCGYQML